MSSFFLSRRLFAQAVAAALIPYATHQAGAAQPSNEAKKTVSSLVSDIWQIFRQDDLADTERIEAIGEIIDRNTDTGLPGRLWRQMSDAQRQHYEQHFPGYIRRALARQLLTAAGDVDGALEDHFQLLDSEKDVIIHSEIVRSEGQTVAVDWRCAMRQERRRSSIL
jgi:phospholipid transport system substrate-binding protein